MAAQLTTFSGLTIGWGDVGAGELILAGALGGTRVPRMQQARANRD